MKKLFYTICFAVVIAVTACHEDNEEYFAEADITVNAGDTLTVDRVQATAVLTNLNTRQVTTSADFNGQTLRISLLRGAYTDYAEMAQTSGNRLVLNLIWMDR